MSKIKAFFAKLFAPKPHVCQFNQNDVLAYAFVSVHGPSAGIVVQKPRCIHCGKELDVP
jgi:hypothetical protein